MGSSSLDIRFVRISTTSVRSLTLYVSCRMSDASDSFISSMDSTCSFVMLFLLNNPEMTVVYENGKVISVSVELWLQSDE